MKIRVLFSLTLLLLGAAIYFVMRSFTLPLVNYVVCQAFQQKAPRTFSAEEIRQFFQTAFEKSQGSRPERQKYLEQLFRLSQKLEKVQSLSREEAQSLLGSFHDPEKAHPPALFEDKDEK